jgi:heterotetrameric sarcosine oxidase delta subunit
MRPLVQATIPKPARTGQPVNRHGRRQARACIVVPICLVCRGLPVGRAREERTLSFLISCPNCGAREATDFAFGGEVSARPRSAPSWRELNDYNYFRRNVAGIQREWWYHRSGCRAWFIAQRDTRTNVILSIEPRGSGQ